LLSGGAFLGYYHMGVIRALYDEGLLPRVLSGASAGSIMIAVIGTKNDQELQEVILSTDGKNLPSGLRTDFFRFSEELKSEMARKLNYLVPQGLRWITHPIFASLFDRKILNLDTEHFKKVRVNFISSFSSGFLTFCLSLLLCFVSLTLPSLK
jgi:predicted acylesterase/phospholipase RssA